MSGPPIKPDRPTSESPGLQATVAGETAVRSSASSDTLVCAGEVFTDLIFFGLDRLPNLGEEIKTRNFAMTAGGGAAITAAAAARLGRSTQLVTAWGMSSLDAETEMQLEALGVSCSWSYRGADAASGVTVALGTSEDRCFVTRPCSGEVLETHLLHRDTLDRLATAGHVHLALAPDRLAPFRAAVGRIRASGATVSWDLGWNPSIGRSPEFRQLCRELDVLFLNEIEACSYAGMPSAGEALQWFSGSSNTVVIKLGAAGSVASQWGGEPVHVEGIRVDSVDTTGAGDAFDGGFLHAWLGDRTLDRALVAGNVCGGLSTRSAGGCASLPSLSEFGAHRGAYSTVREGDGGVS